MVYIYLHLPHKFTIHVGKYTRFMDPTWERTKEDAEATMFVSKDPSLLNFNPANLKPWILGI